MPNLTNSQLIVRPNAPFGRASANPIGRRVQRLIEAERSAANEAAEIATETSRQKFHYLREPISGLRRRGRSSTGGRFASHIKWERDTESGVQLNLQELDAEAPHWPLLELGTGKSARMRWGGDDDPSNPRARAAQIKTIPSQRGRRIHGSLVFADGPGGNYSPPGASRSQQLFYRDQIAGTPRYRREIRIRREIKGQHFIQKGAQAGFRHYRTKVLAAARQNFRKGSP